MIVVRIKKDGSCRVTHNIWDVNSIWEGLVMDYPDRLEIITSIEHLIEELDDTYGEEDSEEKTREINRLKDLENGDVYHCGQEAIIGNISDTYVDYDGVSYEFVRNY